MFVTEFDTVVDSKGAEISMPVTSTKDLSTLSPIVEVCKKKHSFKKQNFKENCQFDKCHIVTFLKVKARGSVNPRSLLVSKNVRALEQVTL